MGRWNKKNRIERTRLGKKKEFLNTAKNILLLRNLQSSFKIREVSIQIVRFLTTCI
jgi:uncharacterized protein YeeX (DUF496 family)